MEEEKKYEETPVTQETVETPESLEDLHGENLGDRV